MPPYLALRRLGAARGLLVVLAVVSAVSFGAFFYAETLATSLSQTTDEKAYTANGSDVAGDRPGERGAAARLPVPDDEDRVRARLRRGGHRRRDAARRARRRPARRCRRVLHWQSAWGPNPTGAARKLAGRPATPLPVIVTAERAADARGLDPGHAGTR